MRDLAPSSGSLKASGAFALLTLFLASLAGCSRSQSGDSRQVGPVVAQAPVSLEKGGEFDPIANPAAKKGGSFTTWVGEYPKTLNMWLDYNSFTLESTGLLMYETLITLHPTREEPIGVLAESWNISPDGKTYTFKINPAAIWSDGQPVTAEDVQFYYDVIMNPKNLTPIFRVDLSRFSRPEVVDPKTVRITAQDAHWKNFWAAGGFYAFPKHAWKDRDFNEINFELPVVSGTYKVYQVNTNRSIVLQRRDDYWGRNLKINQYKYNFDYLVFRFVDDQTKALEMFKRGDYDMYPIYTSRIWVQQTDFPQVQKNWVVRQSVYNDEPKAFQGFAINMRRPQFQDVRVREALAHILNRETLMERIMFNEYFLLNSYYPSLYPKNLNPAAPMLRYDPERARALLADAGWKVDTDGVLKKDGKPFELVFLHHGESLPHLNIYLEDLKAVGIQARIEVLSFASYTKRRDDHDFDMLWENWNESRLRDPETLWASKAADEVASENISGVKDPEIDALIERQKTEMDLNKRNEILRQIDDRLVRIMPYVLLWQSDHNRLLYWNRFGTPKDVLDRFDHEDYTPIYWWFDPDKSARLDEAMKADRTLPALPGKVQYGE